MLLCGLEMEAFLNIGCILIGFQTVSRLNINFAKLGIVRLGSEGDQEGLTKKY